MMNKDAIQFKFNKQLHYMAFTCYSMNIMVMFIMHRFVVMLKL